MNTKRVNTVAGVILAALQQNRTASGIALALESAQLLMSPEVAAELEAADGTTRRIAPAQALDEDPYHLRHTYRLSRDLPPIGGGS